MKIDETARELGKSRSLFIREATERYLAEIDREKADAVRKKRLADALETQDRLRKAGGVWNGAAEIRKWRDHR